MPRISQLPSLTAADNADEIAIVDVSSSTTKKITRGDLLKAPLPAGSVTLPAINGGSTAGVLVTNAAGAVQIKNGTNPKFVQTGTGTINVINSGGGGGTVNITFPTPFSNTPRVFCQLIGTGADMMAIHTSSVTTTGFSALARKSGTTLNSQVFHWMAIDPIAQPVEEA